MNSEQNKKSTIKANLVIIGGGGAGMAAALSAIQQGIKDVYILEKRLNIGGNSSLAGGMIFAARDPKDTTKIKPERGNPLAGGPGYPDDVFKETMSFHHYDRVNPRIMRALINKSVGTIPWLNKWLEDYGTDTYRNQGPPGSFGKLMKMFAEKFELGGGRILRHTAAKKILKDKDGKVTGVIAANKEGKEIRINAGAVMIATGGFPGNKKLLKKYFPYYYDDVYYTDTIPIEGDGIQLAQKAGAYLEDYCTLIRENGYSFETGKNTPNRAAMEPFSVWVNGRGERFLDESICRANPSTNALLAQPGKVGFALFDDNLVRIMNERSIPGAPGLDLKKFFKAENQKGKWIKIADTWNEIASWIGTDVKALNETVSEYNSFCDKGHDDVFAKDKDYLMPLREPPFYSIKFRPIMIDTVGPVRVNDRFEVLDKQEKPIPGLYAGGVITAGWQGYDYYLFGSALGLSLNSGRIAGESAVKYLQSV
jgi:fumarate reductase flavoprotein subunit